MSMALDTSLLEDLSLDELRWLEASEILEFPATPSHSFTFNDSVVHPFSNCRQWSEPRSKHPARSTRRSERLHHNPPSQSISTSLQDSSSARIHSKASTAAPWTSSLPTPPSTPTRTPSTYAPRMGLSESPTTTQPWLHRQPRAITPKGSPTPSVLSSSLPINHQFSSTSNKSCLSRTSSVASTVATPTAMKAPILSIPFGQHCGPRSRSLRSVPTLKTIPSQSEVNLRTPSLIMEEDDTESSSSDLNANAKSATIPRSAKLGKRTLSTGSSTSSTSSQSEVPSTPSDPYSAFLKSAQAQTRSFYDRRYMTNSGSHRPQLGGLNPALSSSCPSKSILARTPSVSTAKESPTTATAPTAAQKSVKFAEMPTVHYGSGRAREAEVAAEAPPPPSPIDKVDSQTGLYRDLPEIRSRPPVKRVSRLERARPAVRPVADLDVPTPSNMENELVEGKEGSALKRFMPFARRPSASRSPRPTNRTTPPPPPLPSSGTNTPSSAPIPVPPLSINSGRPSISGPYALGSFVPSSPTHSTSSLRSNMSKSSRKSTYSTRGKASGTNTKTPRAFFSFTSTSTTPTSSISHLYGTGTSSLEDYRKNGGEATKSVRSLSSVKSSTSATTGLKSWLSRFGR
ncbi:hypothetical protein BKA70DRAFT_1417897 [Coprinopsis sp. MPI-PUGE-AT-0042]|nr:hypothetical protein BKA70DRAFT_1417897 [Coprinopsis sp. MPI-PUGE-AT-0042]